MGYFLFVSLSVRKDIKLRKLRDYRLIANDITLILAFPILTPAMTIKVKKDN
ncbi:hypothetical protein ACNR90_000041 (mitochondrion) [Candidozyma auris]